jgi:hypothetical protein
VTSDWKPSRVRKGNTTGAMLYIYIYIYISESLAPVAAERDQRAVWWRFKV